MQDRRSDEFLEDLALGRLDPDLADRAMRHIRQCDDCRQKLAETEAFIFTLRGALLIIDQEKQHSS